MTRVLIADDHAAVRRSLTQALEMEPDVEVVGEAPDGSSAVELARELSPDVVFMDVVMPSLGGIEATRQILEQCPRRAGDRPICPCLQGLCIQDAPGGRQRLRRQRRRRAGTAPGGGRRLPRPDLPEPGDRQRSGVEAGFKPTLSPQASVKEDPACRVPNSPFVVCP